MKQRVSIRLTATVMLRVLAAFSGGWQAADYIRVYSALSSDPQQNSSNLSATRQWRALSALSSTQSMSTVTRRRFFSSPFLPAPHSSVQLTSIGVRVIVCRTRERRFFEGLRLSSIKWRRRSEVEKEKKVHNWNFWFSCLLFVSPSFERLDWVSAPREQWNQNSSRQWCWRFSWFHVGVRENSWKIEVRIRNSVYELTTTELDGSEICQNSLWCLFHRSQCDETMTVLVA